VSQSLSARPNRYEAKLTLHASADAMRKRVPKYWGPFEPIDDATCGYRTGDDNLDWLAARIMMLGVDFDVHEPPELIAQFATLGERLGRLGG
jgi:predicted DNA-binding transcriptional regulator YafY